MVEQAIKKRLDAIIITEHNVLWRKEELEELQDKYPEILILNGVEVRADAVVEWYDILVYGPPPDSYIPCSLSAEEITEYFKPYGYAMVLAHPFRYSSKMYINDETLKMFHAIESDSSNFNPNTTKLSIEMAKKLSLPVTVASDSHCTDTVGRWYIETPEFRDMEGFIEIIKKGKWTCRWS